MRCSIVLPVLSATLATATAGTGSPEYAVMESFEINGTLAGETGTAGVYASVARDHTGSQPEYRWLCAWTSTPAGEDLGCTEGDFDASVDPAFSRASVDATVATPSGTITVEVTVDVDGPLYPISFGGGPSPPPGAGASAGADLHRVGIASGSITSSLDGSFTGSSEGWIGKAVNAWVYADIG